MVNNKKMAYLGKTKEQYSFYKAKEGVIDFSRKLRKRMTPGEKILWKKLRRKKIKGVRIRRQHPIEYYIADFYCPSENLIIELDGQHHFTPEGIAKDLDRDNHLKMMNIKVLRFENKVVLNNLSQVLKTIKEHFKTTL